MILNSLKVQKELILINLYNNWVLQNQFQKVYLHIFMIMIYNNII